MGFNIKRKERVQKAFHRLGRSQVKKALKQLREPDELEACMRCAKPLNLLAPFFAWFELRMSKARYPRLQPNRCVMRLDFLARRAMPTSSSTRWLI